MSARLWVAIALSFGALDVCALLLFARGELFMGAGSLLGAMGALYLMAAVRRVSK